MAIIRLEQYYPFPMEEMARTLLPYADKEFVWCQEEPKNMGAWTFLAPLMEKLFSFMKIQKKILYAGRPQAAAPATGSPLTHEKEQKNLLDQAFWVEF